MAKLSFGENAYIELQRHGRAQEEDAEALLLTLADETGLALVAAKIVILKLSKCLYRNVFSDVLPDLNV